MSNEQNGPLPPERLCNSSERAELWQQDVERRRFLPSCCHHSCVILAAGAPNRRALAMASLASEYTVGVKFLTRQSARSSGILGYPRDHGGDRYRSPPCERRPRRAPQAHGKDERSPNGQSTTHCWHLGWHLGWHLERSCATDEPRSGPARPLDFRSVSL